MYRVYQKVAASLAKNVPWVNVNQNYDFRFSQGGEYEVAVFWVVAPCRLV
jgi:hypothetical protein